MGSCLSIIFTIVVLLYAYLKADVLISRRDVDILSTVFPNKFTPDDTFSYQNGLNIAVALTAYDNDPNPILDPTYGEIVFHHSNWGPSDNEAIQLGQNRFESHMCTKAELGLEEKGTNGSSSFFPIEESMK